LLFGALAEESQGLYLLTVD